MMMMMMNQHYILIRKLFDLKFDQSHFMLKKNLIKS